MQSCDLDSWRALRRSRVGNLERESDSRNRCSTAQRHRQRFSFRSPDAKIWSPVHTENGAGRDGTERNAATGHPSPHQTRNREAANGLRGHCTVELDGDDERVGSIGHRRALLD
eukprot:3935488-Rhodomonas_salina.1